jgi:hypothetical protein
MSAALDMAGDLRCALDPVAFAVERLNFIPDAWQTKVLRSSGQNILLNCSRQAGKSTTTSIIALHTAFYQPEALTLLVSPSLRQSRELFAKVCDFMRMLEPRPILEEDNRLSFTLGNGSRVVSLPGTAETVRGFSAPRLVIEDEAAFVEDGLYGAVRPMLAVSSGRLILMSTPHGKRGHFHEAWKDGGPEWLKIEVSALDCPRISDEFLEQERQALGDLWFRQEYGCEFLETIDQVFRYDDIARALSDDVEPLSGADDHRQAGDARSLLEEK